MTEQPVHGGVQGGEIRRQRLPVDTHTATLCAPTDKTGRPVTTETQVTQVV